MPSRAGDRAGGARAVAGRHDDAEAERVQRRERRRGRRLHRVGDRDEAGEARRRRRPPSPSRRRRGGRRRSGPRRAVDAEPGHHPGVAERDGAAVDAAAHPEAGQRLEVLDRRERRAARLGAARRSPRRAGARSRARGSAARRSTSASSWPGAASTAASSGRPRVRVPVLSTTRVSTAAKRLQRLGVADQHAGLRAAPGRGHDRDRRREAERAGAGDDQHRDRRDQRVGERRRRAPERPGDEGEDGDGDHRRHEPAGDARRRRAGSARASAAPRRPSRRCGRAACRRRRGVASTTRLPLPFSVAPVTGSPAAFSTGTGSPVSIDSSTDERPSTTVPSTGTFSPGRTRSRSPTATAASGTSSSRPSARITRARRRREVEQRADRRAGALAGAELEDLAEQHQHDDDRGRLEVDADLARGGRGSRRGTGPARQSRRR